ncbi:MAG: hypothetical protein ABIW80_09490, partial [Lapillicoccus sp.]
MTAGEQGRPGGWVPGEPSAVAAPDGSPPADPAAADPPAADPPAADPLAAGPLAAGPLAADIDAGPDTQPVTRASLRAAREAQTRRVAPVRTEPAGAAASGPAFLAAAGSGVALALLL